MARIALPGYEQFHKNLSSLNLIEFRTRQDYTYYYLSSLAVFYEKIGRLLVLVSFIDKSFKII